MAMCKNRRKAMEMKKVRKEAAMLRPGGKSNYARKYAYLVAHGGWGFDYAEPKPWK